MRRHDMIADPSSRSALLKAVGLFMGATFFAYLFSIFLHELGHYRLIGFQRGVMVLSRFQLGLPA
jgi:hypothetical protein